MREALQEPEGCRLLKCPLQMMEMKMKQNGDSAQYGYFNDKEHEYVITNPIRVCSC